MSILNLDISSASVTQDLKTHWKVQSNFEFSTGCKIVVLFKVIKTLQQLAVFINSSADDVLLNDIDKNKEFKAKEHTIRVQTEGVNIAAYYLPKNCYQAKNDKISAKELTFYYLGSV